jgi:hypothetical protein
MMCRFMGDLCSHNRAVGGTEKRREGEEKERIRKLLLLPLAFCLQFHNIIITVLLSGEYNYQYRTAIVV